MLRIVGIVVGYAGGFGLIVAVVTIRGLSWSTDLGLVFPGVFPILGWVVAWAVWLAGVEALQRWLGVSPPPPRQFRGQAERIALLGIAVLVAPVVEELLFRGLLYWRVVQTPLGPPGAIVLGALLFALLHYRYSLVNRAFVASDGLLYGLVRWHSGSLLIPALLHMMANFYAFVQRDRNSSK